MATINTESFSNKLEYTEKDFKQFLKSNSNVIVFTKQGLDRFVCDSASALKKSIGSEELSGQIFSQYNSVMDSLVGITLVNDKLQKSRVYVALSSLVNEQAIFEDNLITRSLDIADCNVGIEIEKGKKGQIGEIRDWAGGKYQKTAQGWVPVKDQGNRTRDLDQMEDLERKRRQETRQKIESESKTSQNEQNKKNFPEGTRVISEIYGKGTVQRYREGNEQMGTISVKFDKETYGKFSNGSAMSPKGIKKLEESDKSGGGSQSQYKDGSDSTDKKHKEEFGNTGVENIVKTKNPETSDVRHLEAMSDSELSHLVKFAGERLHSSGLSDITKKQVRGWYMKGLEEQKARKSAASEKKGREQIAESSKNRQGILDHLQSWYPELSENEKKAATTKLLSKLQGKYDLIHSVSTESRDKLHSIVSSVVKEYGYDS